MKFLPQSQIHQTVRLPVIPIMDVGLQLLILFMLQLRMWNTTAAFDINMPLNYAPQHLAQNLIVPEIKLRMLSDKNGNLTQLNFGERNLGAGDGAFEALSAEILKSLGTPGSPATKDIEIEIDADFELQYDYVIRAVASCTGKVDPQTQQLVRYIDKIRFAPPRPPQN